MPGIAAEDVTAEEAHRRQPFESRPLHWVDQAQRVRPGRGFAAAADAQLAEDVRHVDARRLGRDEQLGGDLPVAAPGRDEAEHLQLALGEAELAARAVSATRANQSVVAGQPDPAPP